MTKLVRAYSLFEMKSFEEKDGKRTFEGIATTPATDSYGDIVDPEGAVFDLPLPFLWMHDSSDPVGWIHTAKPSKKGIPITGEVANIADEGDLKKRLDMAWHYFKNKLVRGLSIGFNPLESTRIEGTYGYHFLKWRWVELSGVTIPANHEASITAIKSIDTKLRAASGLEQRSAPRPVARSPRVSGTPTPARPGGFFILPE